MVLEIRFALEAFCHFADIGHNVVVSGLVMRVGRQQRDEQVNAGIESMFAIHQVRIVGSIELDTVDRPGRLSIRQMKVPDLLQPNRW